MIKADRRDRVWYAVRPDLDTHSREPNIVAIPSPWRSAFLEGGGGRPCVRLPDGVPRAGSGAATDAESVGHIRAVPEGTSSARAAARSKHPHRRIGGGLAS
jgi:hypothetical protein